MDTLRNTSLKHKNIVIGVTGGIAAYKTADLTRRLLEVDARVRIVMTKAATEFVTPLTFQALSGEPVFVDGQDTQATEDTTAMQHIELARWADAIVIAPASANTIAKLAHGRADNLLTTLCLASEARKCFAPAMNRIMWSDLSTQANCRNMVDKGWLQLGPASGLQACGEIGEGRMLEVSDIMHELSNVFTSGELQGLNVVVTAGPTYEAIDPVRFIGNRSSGKMGYAIAQAATEAGANVTLVSGPTHLPQPEAVTFISIESAAEMLQAVDNNIANCDIYISAAAVADYRMASVAEQKIKKADDGLTLTLTQNDDILSLVAARHSPPYLVGFAAETENILANAKDKLTRKKLDMIIANDVSGQGSQPDIGFNSEYNALHVFWKQYKKGSAVLTDVELERAQKTRLAQQLISLIAREYTDKQSHKDQQTKNSA